MEDDEERFLVVRQESLANPPRCDPSRSVSPTFRRVFASAHATNSLILPDACLSDFDMLRLEALFHAGMARDEQCAENSVLGFEQVMLNLKSLMEDHPEAATQVVEIAWNLVRTYGLLIRDFVVHQGNKEMAIVRPLIKQNTSKAAAVKLAKECAANLWQADAEREFSLSDMAKQVKDILAREGVKDLPETIDRIKDWIRPVAPDYARKAGRRRKTP